MTDHSRREFFRSFTYDLFDQVDLGAAKKILAKMSIPARSAQPAGWMAVGRMAEFAPGVVREVRVGADVLIIRSEPEGLWAERSGGQRVALRSGPGGVVEVNCDEGWPRSRMLSHLTGELKDE